MKDYIGVIVGNLVVIALFGGIAWLGFLGWRSMESGVNKWFTAVIGLAVLYIIGQVVVGMALEQLDEIEREREKD